MPAPSDSADTLAACQTSEGLRRRALLKAGALSMAALALRQTEAGEPAGELPADPADPYPDGLPEEDGLQWNKAPCRFCGTGCHVMVGVKDDKVQAIAGDVKADVNKGLLCVKGYHVGAALYGKDRLTTPLKRVGDKQVPISWDEAIRIIAEKIAAKPKNFAIYGSGQWTIPEGYICNKFIKGGLANNHIDPNARLCMASAVTGFISTYGVDEPAGAYDDLDACDVCIFWGNNPAEMHPILFSRLVDRRSRGEKVTLIDITTRHTRSSQYADEVLIFKPQTDMVILNGIAHLLLKRGTFDKGFVERHCNFRKEPGKPDLKGVPATFEEYQALLEKYTPAYVEELSGVPAAKIELLADLFGRRDITITSLWCMGMNQHTRGTAVNRQVHGIHLLSGHFGKPGDAPTSLTGQPSACGTAREVGTLCHTLPGGRLVAKEAHRSECEEVWKLPKGHMNPKPGYHTVKMWESFSTPSDQQGGEIATIWVQVTNPGQSLPNLTRLVTDSRKLGDKFLIVSDVYPTETTRVADLVLPSAMWVEKNGLFGNSERRTQQWFKMVEPPGQARDDAWQVLAVARKLHDMGMPGLKGTDGKFLFHMTDDQGKEVRAWEWEHYYDINVDKVLFEEYRVFTRMKHKDLAPYEVYVKAHGLRWPVVEQADGSWRETKFRFSEFDDPYVKKGSTIDFYHSTTGDGKAQIWLHDYVPSPEEPDDEYPFWLSTGRVLEHWHTGSMTMRIPQLARAMPNAYVEIHRQDADRLRIRSGQMVTIETRRGALRLPAWIDGRASVVPGSLFIPFFDERLLANLLTNQYHCPISKEPDYKKCAARIALEPG